MKKVPSEKELKNAVAEAEEYLKRAGSFPGGMTALKELENNTYALNAFADYTNKYRVFCEVEARLNDLLKRDIDPAAINWIDNETEFCQYLQEHPAALKEWGLYNQIKQECIKVGLEPVVEAYENGTKTELIIPGYKKGLYYALINEIISTDDVLSSFSGVTFNESIRQFKKLDDKMLQQTKSEIFYILASRIPSSGDSPSIGMELNLLRKAIGSNARGMSIRALFDRIPHVLQKLCPCMLMSPNSVARYLAQNNEMFDVVIFDEASQLPTCKAVGALSRAKNAVIVGDPKQMPPTSFFAGSGPNVEDLVLDDLDSILDDALALGIPSCHLQWHYRSTHESLIAFSNSEFYDNKMFTFPSANDRERHVTAIHVEGTYKNGTNIEEAEAVVAEVIRRFHDPELNSQSVGVVTFNVKQQALIENLLTKQYQTDPEFDAWANNAEDPLFVKNLENVQGDERDVILFSIGYGPDEKGRISMNFGPINQAGGGKRLNVAFSRSRVTMMIFSSIYSSDIRITESSPDGLVAFRDFLSFAEGHELKSEDDASDSYGVTKEGILQSICKSITDNGFQCVQMVGHSDFHVDIAVVDPFEPTKYLMGILLDGDGYRKTGNTRDREIAQISVLKNLGWKLHRIWTVDWWDNREKELRKLASILEDLKLDSQKKYEEAMAGKEAEEAARIRAEEQEEAIREELEKQVEEVIAEGQEAVIEEQESRDIAESSAFKAGEPEPPTEAGQAELPAEAGQAELPSEAGSESDVSEETVEDTSDSDHQEESVVITPVPYVYAELEKLEMSTADYCSAAAKAEIEKRIISIVEAEAPILKESLIRKVMASCRVNKSAAALQATEKAIKAAKIKSTKQKGIVFCWAPGQDPKAYYGLRVSNERSGEEICPQELRNGIVYALQNKKELSKEELIKEASLVFGYKRLGKNLEAALTAGVQFARSTGAIVYVPGGTFRLP